MQCHMWFLLETPWGLQDPCLKTVLKMAIRHVLNLHALEISIITDCWEQKMDQRSSTCIENTLHNQESKAVVNTYEPPCNFVLVPISLVAIVNFVITRYIVFKWWCWECTRSKCARASNKKKAPTATPTGSSWPPPTVSKALPKANVRIIYGFPSPSLLSIDSIWICLSRTHL